MAKRSKRSKIGRPRGKEPLSKKHYTAIHLLVYNFKLTHEQVADVLGITRKTLYNWRQRKDFDRAYTKELTKMINALKRQSRRISHVDLALKGDIKAIEFVLGANEMI